MSAKKLLKLVEIVGFGEQEGVFGGFCRNIKKKQKKGYRWTFFV